MKDRFRFRVFLKYNQIMGNIDSYCFLQGLKKCVFHFTNGGQKTLKNDDFILMQCTGLKDKNGKLIYEGDIINIWCKNYSKNQISEVKFCKERAAFTFDYFTDFGNIVPCTMEKTEIEVIGNIYENKDLL